MTDTRHRILFVDDDPEILAALRNLLHKDRKRWDLAFAEGGEPALVELRKQAFDVVVSDMRMPGMDGAALLAQIKAEFPATVRIMLSGQADRDAIVRALPSLHQLLSKPCDAETLRSTIERSLACGSIDAEARIGAVIGRLDKLPSPPKVYIELKKLMESPTAGVGDVARVVLRDPGLAAKVLQLVNSAYFGARTRISSIEQAVSLLGSDRLRYLALSSSIFSAPDRELYSGITVEQLQETSLRAAGVARTFLTGAERDDGFAAALLHDVGHLVLALGLPDEYAIVKARARSEAEVSIIEREILGVTHADVGAWLLALWGLPNRIVDVVRWHHDPGSALVANRVVASAVHVADVVARDGTIDELDHAALGRAGTAEQAATWFASAQGA